VELYAACELTSGKRLIARGRGHTVVLPVPLAEARAAGVTIEGFSQVVVDRGLTHRSLCHCFHGTIDALTSTGVSCRCEAGWAGDRCDRCASEDLCVLPAKRTAAVQRLLKDAPAGLQADLGARLRTAELAETMLQADSVVVAGVGEIRELQRPTMTPTYLETFTEAELVVKEVLRGANVSRTWLSFAGPADPAHPQFSQESPDVWSGSRRLYALRLRPGRTNPVPGAADWPVGKDDTINLGFYRVSLASLREALR
jgi:hypothetical protein